ncbi:MAG: UDP-3-O-(3-hydroxymyristoyl)glucosamine N-acyltransferase [Planctomycetota bacterium]|jgi:UDP-3-O-[3-hydroxymyristoyl] glucosamine N-acyltransferase
MNITVLELAKKLEAELAGDGTALVTQVEGVEAAGANSVTFMSDAKYGEVLGQSSAAAVIVGSMIEGLSKPQLIVNDVNAALIKALTIFAPKLKPAAEGVDASAVVGRNVELGRGISIGPYAVLSDNVVVGDNSVISGGCKVGENSRIGSNSRIESNVVIYHNCVIGSNVVIQANSVIGSTGFGYSFIDGSHRLIPHNGGVVIEDFVDIGSNCSIDRAKFGNTVIGAGTKIDNLVQIAHNVVIGKCCLIIALVGISGSCKIGDGVVLAGQAGIADNVEIGAGVMVAGRAGVLKDVKAGKRLFGYPAMDYGKAFRIMASQRKLPGLLEQFRDLSKRVERLEASKDDRE